MGDDLSMRRSEYWAMKAMQCLPDQVCAQDTDGKILVANRAMANTFGHSDGACLIGKSVFDIFPAETASTMRAIERQVIETGRPVFDQEQEILHSCGERRWIRTSRIPLHDGDGKIVGLICTSRDVTESKESDELVLAQARLLDMIAQSAPADKIFSTIVSVVETHIPRTIAAIQLVSPDGRRLLRTTAPSIPDEIVAALGQDAGGSLALAMMPELASGEPLVVPDIRTDPRIERLGISADFPLKTFWCAPIFSPDGKRLGALSLFSDAAAAPTAAQSDIIAMASHMVSAAVERQETEERNKFLASHDDLTGLMNRMRFEICLADTLRGAEKAQTRIGLAFFDVDNFKLVNDSLGHTAGDAVLKALAERATNTIRTGDVVARMGGDEFLIFLSNLSHCDEVNEKRFRQLHESISAPVSLNGKTIHVTCSMGVAYYPIDALEGPSLIANADIAMYHAKKMGRDNIQFFDRSMLKSAAKTFSLHSELCDAVSRKEFVLHYQPQIDLEKKRIFAAESLVRWQHPSLGLLLPGDFIPAAEETGLIIPLGDWILDEACQQNKRWQNEGLPRIVVNVNVSARQFQETNLVARVSAALAASRLEPRYLELELTESLIMQEGATAKMLELDALGVKLAIDDFGTGYSSLSALKNFPVSRLKIDRSFIREILDDRKDQAITSAIIALADRLQMAVIAEGVESIEQVDLLHRLGCNEIQGFYFSRPVVPEEFSNLLAERDHLVTKFSPLTGSSLACAKTGRA